MAKTYDIAVIPGDGIGKEVVPEGIRVLEAAAAKQRPALPLGRVSLELPAPSRQHGRMMPENGLDLIRHHDAIFLGAVGFPGVPDHVPLRACSFPSAGASASTLISAP